MLDPVVVTQGGTNDRTVRGVEQVRQAGRAVHDILLPPGRGMMPGAQALAAERAQMGHRVEDALRQALTRGDVSPELEPNQALFRAQSDLAMARLRNDQAAMNEAIMAGARARDAGATDKGVKQVWNEVQRATRRTQQPQAFARQELPQGAVTLRNYSIMRGGKIGYNPATQEVTINNRAFTPAQLAAAGGVIQAGRWYLPKSWVDQQLGRR